MQINRDILAAIAQAKPSKSGGIKLIELREALHTVAASTWWHDIRACDRQLQAARKAGYATYRGSRDPKTGKPRKHWGWVLTREGEQALQAAPTAT